MRFRYFSGATAPILVDVMLSIIPVFFRKMTLEATYLQSLQDPIQSDHLSDFTDGKRELYICVLVHFRFLESVVFVLFRKS